MTERRLDEAIDRAVHEMMHVDPRPGLSRRVAARLAVPRTARLTAPRLASAAALILLALAAALLVTRTPAPVREQVSVTRETIPPAPRVNRAPATTPEQPARVPPARVTRAPGSPRRGGNTIEATPPFASNVQIAPLADLTPIAVEPAGPRALDAPEVVVTPLAPLEPLRVDPLSSTPR